ncbi:MAG: site-specific DNA-methyltransferase [Deltaproteobacteria bacterium]|nr:site-specific DNA-methyltransferase [Deltaproteobacteria bacterium]
MEKLPRIDDDDDLRRLLEPHCRLKRGEIWEDPLHGHRVGCLDATSKRDVVALMAGETSGLAIQDPPYNIVLSGANTIALSKTALENYIAWSKCWVGNTIDVLSDDASLYVWLGADQRDGFQPLPDFMLMMRGFDGVKTRSFITMRNQRGYGTQKNWMAVRQELLYYIKGNPGFNVKAEYTDIPKILRGYYKKVDGRITENLERGKSDNIRAGNVWVDVQQVFYRMEENVPGCYAQKPLKSTERIVEASSTPGELIADFFAHSGTTLMAAERLQRRCFTMDVDPIFAEITIRRLENFRKTGRCGWQFNTPFPEAGFNIGTGDGLDDGPVHNGPVQEALFAANDCPGTAKG